MNSYEGPVVFASDGVHYPLVEDPDGEPDEQGNLPAHPDLSRPLRVAEDGSYREADEGEPLHNDVFHEREAVIDTRRVEMHPPGQDIYPLGAHVVSYEAGVYHLVEPWRPGLTAVPGGGGVEWYDPTRPLSYDGDRGAFVGPDYAPPEEAK